VKDEMTTLEQDERLDAEETELTVQVARFAVSVPEGIAKPTWASRAAAKTVLTEIIVTRDGGCQRDAECMRRTGPL
jgi:hypothetical protein